MIDAEVDAERAANARAAEFAERRMCARMASLSAEGAVRGRRGGTLAALPSAPPERMDVAEAVPVAVQAGAHPVRSADVAGAFSGATQFLIAAALVAVLFVAWIAERRSARKDVEGGYG